ncbi:MAG TPA: response regulator [Micropepsaceae bacterium]|jgi:PleD family two-component response regulator|nr:response regulator [Micropepsaceae bacterium]
MKTENLTHLHILIVDGKAGNARLLRGILLALGIANVVMAENTDQALETMAITNFHVVFCDEAVGPLDAAEFVLAVRRKAKVRNPRAAMVLVSDGPQRAQVEQVRDAGINDLIVRPLSMNSVERKLHTLLFAPKRFVESEAFFGPDRRREKDRRAGEAENSAPLHDRREGQLLRRRTDPRGPSAR